MDEPISRIVFALVDDLPSEYVGQIASILDKEAKLNWDRFTNILQAAVPQNNARDQVRNFVSEWKVLAVPPSPQEMALLLRTTAFALEQQKDKQKIELTWTGPKTHDINLRRTDQALLELINAAQIKILIVSFVVYKAQNILSALEKAAMRGVETFIILESPDDSEGQLAFSSIAALGSSLQSKAHIFIWPYSKRPTADNGTVGVLHAKVAVADSQILYISSANLTEHAMSLNIEMGVLICGGELPSRVDQHFRDLIANGIIVEVAGK